MQIAHISAPSQTQICFKVLTRVFKALNRRQPNEPWRQPFSLQSKATAGSAQGKQDWLGSGQSPPRSLNPTLLLPMSQFCLLPSVTQSRLAPQTCHGLLYYCCCERLVKCWHKARRSGILGINNSPDFCRKQSWRHRASRSKERRALFKLYEGRAGRDLARQVDHPCWQQQTEHRHQSSEGKALELLGPTQPVFRSPHSVTLPSKDWLRPWQLEAEAAPVLHPCLGAAQHAAVRRHSPSQMH